MLIHGQTSTNLLTPLLVDATGRPLVVLDSVTGGVVTVQATGGDKIFAYESAVYQNISNAALAAGTNQLVTATVGTGKVWIVSSIAIRYIGVVATVQLFARVYNGATFVTAFHISPPVSGQIYDRQGQWIVPATGYVDLIVLNATLNDSAELHVNGYQMDA